MERDQTYYYERAETELMLAQQATDPVVVKTHYQLAGYYLDRVHGDGDHSELSSNVDTGVPADKEIREKAIRLANQLRAAGVIIVGPPASH